MTMNTFPATKIVLLIFVSLIPGAASAQLTAAVPSPVDHPVMSPASYRSPYAWRISTGDWGESFVDHMLRLRGFDEVLEIKFPGRQGIDRVALRYNASGQISDLRFVEAKTHRGVAARLADTQDGLQLSRKWLYSRLRQMLYSSDRRCRELGNEISRFLEATGMPIEQFGEFHELNTRTGRYIRWNPLTGAELSNESLERLLRRMKTRLPSESTRRWAREAHDSWEKIRATSMGDWLASDALLTGDTVLADDALLAGKAVSRRRLLQRGAVEGLPEIAETATGRSLRRLGRAAGPIGIAVAAALDAYELYSHEMAYERGEINRRERNIRLSKSVGGLAGAWAGMAAGAYAGSFGGPYLEVTVPIGAFVGGITGYFVGSAATKTVASAWYSHIDDNVLQRVDARIVSTPYPVRGE